MDPRFEPYFRARLEQISRVGLVGAPPEGFGRTPLSDPAKPDPFQAEVFKAVEEGYRSVPGLVRPDAELMLQLVFAELVAQPIRAVRGQDVDRTELLGAIAQDARRITENALPLSKSGGISAHDVVNAASNSWSELRTASFELWD
jgi:hypothetical protein